jgi:xanthine dehydrogenase accessory factor
MISAKVGRRAEELAERGEAYVAATVVRVERPTSVQPGNMALVHEDGTIEGFVGGVCAQHSVRLYSLKAIESGEPLLLRIMGDYSRPPTPMPPDPDEDPLLGAGQEIQREDGAVTVQNPCLSGGSIEVFLEPFLPSPRVMVVGESPIAQALATLGPEVGLDVVAGVDDDNRRRRPQASDLALVVAAHGRDELEALRAGLEAGVEYIGLVASPKRGRAVMEELREVGVSQELLDGIDSPAGYDIGARTPAEIALSILARIIEVRRHGEVSTEATEARGRATRSVATAVDPICGMTVVVGSDTPASERDGEITYFCCEGCKRTFDAQQAA